jgi:hypothetical protein
VTQPANRLGANGTEEIKKHEFFKNIDYEQFKKLNVKPPFIPEVKEDKGSVNY